MSPAAETIEREDQIETTRGRAFKALAPAYIEVKASLKVTLPQA